MVMPTSHYQTFTSQKLHNTLHPILPHLSQQNSYITDNLERNYLQLFLVFKEIFLHLVVVRRRLARGFTSTSPLMSEQMYSLERAEPNYQREISK